MKIGSLALLIPATLVAQAPVPPAAAPNLTQRLRAEGPAIEKLLADLNAREALARAEGLIPVDPPAYDDSTLDTTMASYNAYRSLTYAYFLAGKAADACGRWERALEYFQKAEAAAKKNHEASKPVFERSAKNLRTIAEGIKQNHELDKELISKLKANPNPDAGEQQQLELILQEEKNIENDLKWADIFEKNIETAKKEVDYYGQFAKKEAEAIEGEKTDLAAYKFKNDKLKFVEGIISAKDYFANFPDKAEKVRFLWRMHEMSPENVKVQKELEKQTGLELFPNAPGAAPKPKKGKK